MQKQLRQPPTDTTCVRERHAFTTVLLCNVQLSIERVGHRNRAVET